MCLLSCRWLQFKLSSLLWLLLTSSLAFLLLAVLHDNRNLRQQVNVLQQAEDQRRAADQALINLLNRDQGSDISPFGAIPRNDDRLLIRSK